MGIVGSNSREKMLAEAVVIRMTTQVSLQVFCGQIRCTEGIEEEGGHRRWRTCRLNSLC